jgi:bifunctional DNA-binding transcriptional regulator/antitoxin component of YhaV-PrlF toxin-antitoxin module
MNQTKYTVKLNKDGRITIPKPLRKYIGSDYCNIEETKYGGFIISSAKNRTKLHTPNNNK